jgi:hypothetical protein
MELERRLTANRRAQSIGSGVRSPSAKEMLKAEEQQLLGRLSPVTVAPQPPALFLIPPGAAPGSAGPFLPLPRAPVAPLSPNAAMSPNVPTGLTSTMGPIGRQHVLPNDPHAGTVGAMHEDLLRQRSEAKAHGYDTFAVIEVVDASGRVTRRSGLYQ